MDGVSAVDGARARARSVPVVRSVLVAVALADAVLFLAAIPSRYRSLVALAGRAAARQAELHPGASSVLFPSPRPYAALVLALEIWFVLAFAIVGVSILSGQLRKRTAVLFAATLFTYAVWVTPTADALHLPGPWWVLQTALQFCGLFLAVLFFQVFPDGRFVPRWAPAVAMVWAAYAVVLTFVPDARLSLIDPFDASVPAFLWLMLGGWGVGLLAQILRYRSHADAEQRRQTRIVVIAVFAACVGYSAVYLPGLALTSGTAGLLYDLYGVPAFWIVAAPLPIAFTVAMLRHRLFGASTVLVRSIVVAVLAVFITVVYVAIVAGVGSLVGGTASPNLTLSLAATAVVAVAFQPVRSRAHRLANRLVFGQRTSPYEALAAFAERIGGTLATPDLLPAMARTLAEGTAAAHAVVWLRHGDELAVSAVWPPHAHADVPPLLVVDGTATPRDGAATFLPVFDRGELLGALSFTKPEGERPSATEASLARTLAAEAGLVLRNVRLTQELVERMDDLRASRQRIVTAQDAERRRLERNLHDGAQQQLVALAVKAGLARARLEQDPGAAGRLLEEIQEDAREANQTLRDLARGIYPAVLVDEGPAAALSAQAAKGPVAVEIDAAGVGRFAPELEAAVYFCALEALQNAVKHAEAERIRIELAREGDRVVFRVTDDGAGFDRRSASPGMGLQGMVDRISALGGDLTIWSSPGGGTTVEGRLPVG